LNNRAIAYRPNQNVDVLYNSFADNDEVREGLLGRYDVTPIIERYTDIIFNTFLDSNPEFLNYPYKETNLVRLVIFIAVQNSYLLCLVGCE